MRSPAHGTGFYIVWWRQEPDFRVVVAGSRLSTSVVKLEGNGVNISGSRQPYAYAATTVTWDGVNWRITWGDTATTVWTARVNGSGVLLDPGSVGVSGAEPGLAAGTGVGGIQLVWMAGSDVRSATVGADNTAGPTRTLSLGAPRQLRPHVATGGSGSMLVYRSSTSSEHRVMAQPLDAAGNPATSAPIRLAAGDAAAGLTYPTVAWSDTLSMYLVAWGTAGGVVARRMSADGTAIDAAPFPVMSPAFGPASIAAIGDTFLVAARKIGFGPQYVFPVAARVRGSDAAVLDTTPRVIGHSFASAPAVAPLGGRWLLAWHRNASHDDPYALTQGAFVGVDGTATAEFTIHGPFSTAGGNGVFEVGLASSGEVALLVQSQELTSGVETDLVARLVGADGGVGGAVNLTPRPGNQYRPRAAWDGRVFVVVYQDEKTRVAAHSLDQLDARSDLVGTRVTATGAVVDPQGFVISASPGAETDPVVAGGHGRLVIAGSLLVEEAPFAGYRVAYEQHAAANWPVAVATADVAGGDVPLTVRFSSAGSGALGGGGVSYAWDFGDGTTSTLPDPSHRYASAGAYVVTLAVADGAGAVGTQALVVNATEPNQPPVAAASASLMAGPAPLNVVFFADGSYDPDGFIGNIRWTFSDGGEYWGSPAYHTFSATGRHTATLTVFDSRGATSSIALTIDVGAANQPPAAVAATTTPATGPAPLAVGFTSAGSTDADGRIVSYLWTFGDGTTSTLASPSHTYTAPGVYTAVLTVTDDGGLRGNASVTITAAGVVRSSAITLSAKVNAGRVVVNGVVAVKDGSGVPVPGATVSATWQVPGGATVSQAATTDASGAARLSTSGTRGTYTLTVNDITKPGYSFDPAGSVLSKSIRK